MVGGEEEGVCEPEDGAVKGHACAEQALVAGNLTTPLCVHLRFTELFTSPCP